jgi:ubiquitin fusion degradation protein 1
MMQTLGAQVGEFVKVKTVTLPLGTFVKIQPQTKAFLEISNPKVV